MPILRRHNPFHTKPIIPDKYFCGRQEETKRITALLENGNNVVLAAPRRVGKTTLLHHVLDQSVIRKNYNTFFIDLYDAVSAESFYERVKDAFKKTELSKNERLRFKEITEEYETTISLGGKIASIESSRRIQKKILIENTLSNIFDILATTKKPNIVVFDEFQQIEDFQDKITRFLRTKFQSLANTVFVYSGSETHMLYSMFNNYNEPFYKSSMNFGLKRIELDTYTDFCRRTFKEYGKDVSPEAIQLVYDLFWGNFLNLQQVFNKVFDYTPKGEIADINSIKASIELILEDREELYRGVFRRFSEGKERNLLICIAQEGLAEGLTSSQMIRTYSLGSPSSVQNAIKNLTSSSDNFITKLTGTKYCLSDKFLELWIAQGRSLLELKYASAKTLAIKERSLWDVNLMIGNNQSQGVTKTNPSVLPSSLPLTPGQKNEVLELGYIDGPVVFEGKPYVVQSDEHGSIISIPQSEVLPVLLSDLQAISATVGRTVTSDEVEMLSYGQSLILNGKGFRFDICQRKIVTCLTKRQHQRNKLVRAARQQELRQANTSITNKTTKKKGQRI